MQHNRQVPQQSTAQLHHFFEIQASHQPQKLATKFEDDHWTYQQVNDQAEALAQRILYCYQEKHNAPMPQGTLIGIYQDKTPDLIISMLAVSKAGGAYVPVSPAYPQQRASYLFTDSQVAITLSHLSYKERLNGWLADCHVNSRAKASYVRLSQ